jgi:hypothetical protein
LAKVPYFYYRYSYSCVDSLVSFVLLLSADRMFGSDFDNSSVWWSSWIAGLLPVRAMVA